ncbi:hypothetical protein Bpfe_014949 [Biomphalaria pfeifferi]|uniref:Uncharacterized protein n=1 Tax=Biomphalaria pfeifferi TaxID=112525 RepID=A0AAD8BL19_BIOPF|nr:hypothetical protein Bpfe_014949 [Biomphalaria pfeifferi]
MSVIGGVIKCNHVEEETASELHFVCSPNDKSRAKLMILLNEAEVALCYLRPVNCAVFSTRANATIKNTPTQRYEITVSVLGVKSSGYWKV